MKTVKTMLAGVALLLACVAANATVKKVADHLTQDDVVHIYITDISTNTTTDMDKVLDNDVQFNLQRGQNVNTLTKDDFMNYLNSKAGGEQPVNTSTTVMEQDDQNAKIKVVFKYQNFTRTDVVTLSKTSGWKVTNIDSSFS